MKIDLIGKTALVTGSTAGIGLAIAKGLAGSGARVVVNGRHHDSVERGVAAVQAAVPGHRHSGTRVSADPEPGGRQLVACHWVPGSMLRIAPE